MKKALVVAVSLLTLVATESLWAGFEGPGSQDLTTVAAAKKAPDESYVTLTGNIVKQVKHEYYLFRDATGEIEVEIDADEWGDITVLPETTVRIVGEVDNNIFRGKRIDAKKIEIVSDKITNTGDFSSFKELAELRLRLFSPTNSVEISYLIRNCKKTFETTVLRRFLN